MEEQDKINDILQKMRPVLSRELSTLLDKVGYEKHYGFYFTLNKDVLLDPIHLEGELDKAGIDIISIMGISERVYMVSIDY